MVFHMCTVFSHCAGAWILCGAGPTETNQRSTDVRAQDHLLAGMGRKTRRLESLYWKVCEFGLIRRIHWFFFFIIIIILFQVFYEKEQKFSFCMHFLF